MKLYYIIITTIALLSCKKTVKEIKSSDVLQLAKDTIVNNEALQELEVILDSVKLDINYIPKGNYKKVLHEISKKRIALQSEYSKAPEKTLNNTSNYFLNTLLNNIVPHWYETTWAYEGHTNTPNKGEIACGYFVSTTLQHFGFNLNRYKMAQQAGLNIALSLQPKNKLKIYRNISYSELKKSLLNIYNDGLYFIGLNNHVGYILIKNKELYFLHSSYCDNKVVIEYAEHSYCFQNDIYVFAEISTNKILLKKWILNEHIPIVQ